MNVLFVENDDSFSFNVLSLVPEGARVVRAAEVTSLAGVSAVVIGPGPTDPIRAGLVELVRRVVDSHVPLLGICLGHQAIGLAFGATLVRSPPVHGKVARMTVGGARLLPPGPHQVMRYHSLSLTGVVAPLRTVASLEDGTVMAVEHVSARVVGLQFHPDSFATPDGARFVRPFFEGLA